jgi:hypothetical protein
MLVTPTITSVSPTSGPALGGNSVTVTGTGFTGPATVRFGTVATTFTIDSSTQITAISPGGTGTVQVTVTTPGGTSNGVSYTYVPAPVVSGISPNQGPTSGGNTVTITGTNLSGATTVRFGSTAATSFTVVSSTQITAVAPSGTGTVQVTVTTPSGTSNGVPYTYAAVPAVSGISPNQGPTSGGNTVTITGTNLSGATAVQFGSTAATSFTVVSGTQITAVVPAGAAGSVNVTITAPGGTSTLANSYFYLNTPFLTGVVPNSGPVAGGNTVTLTGGHLIEATAVRFGTTAAGVFTVVSDTQITATAPLGAAGAADVTVTTAGGTSNGVPYTFLTAPTVTGLSPNQGPTSGGNTVTVTGSNLAQTTAVLFGAVPAAFTVISDNHVVAQAPPGTAGPINVTVSTPGGTSAAQIYTRVPPPAI